MAKLGPKMASEAILCEKPEFSKSIGKPNGKSTFLTPRWLPKRAKMAPRRRQEPKMAPRRRQERPRTAEGRPRAAKERPKSGQERAKTSQESQEPTRGPKSAPQEAARTPKKTCLSIEREARYSCDALIAAKSLKSSQEHQKSLFAFGLKKGSWKTIFLYRNNALRALLAPQGRPRAPQERPKGGQERPESAPRAARSGPRAAKSAPRTAQERPRAAQEHPKRPKRCSKRLQESPKRL